MLQSQGAEHSRVELFPAMCPAQGAGALPVMTIPFPSWGRNHASQYKDGTEEQGDPTSSDGFQRAGHTSHLLTLHSRSRALEHSGLQEGVDPGGEENQTSSSPTPWGTPDLSSPLPRMNSSVGQMSDQDTLGQGPGDHQSCRRPVPQQDVTPGKRVEWGGIEKQES